MKSLRTASGALAVILVGFAAACGKAAPVTLVPVPDEDHRVVVQTGDSGWVQQLGDMMVCVLRVNRAGDCTRSPSPPVCDTRTREDVQRSVQPILDSVPRVRLVSAFSMNRDLQLLFPSATPTMEVIDARRRTPCMDWSGGACAAIRTSEIAVVFEGTAGGAPERIAVFRVSPGCRASSPDQ